MGKAVGTIAKHKLCKGTPNETAIVNRVQEIKDAWHASVKSMKAAESATNNSTKPTVKREAETNAESPSPAKRTKTGVDVKKSSSFSTLLKKVSKSSKQAAKGQDARSVDSANGSQKGAEKCEHYPIYIMTTNHHSLISLYFFFPSSFDCSTKEVLKASEVGGPFRRRTD